MQARNLTFFMMLFVTELLLASTFALIVDKQTFYALLTFSSVSIVVIGIIGFLKMQGEPTYSYRDMYDHDRSRFNESL